MITSQQEVTYWLEKAQEETNKAIFALRQVLTLTGSLDKTFNQLLDQKNLVGYSTIGNLSLLQVVREDIESLLDQPGVRPDEGEGWA